MNICEGSKLQVKPGDFGVKIVGKKGNEKLAIPSEVFRILVDLKINTAEIFYEAPFREHVQECLQEALHAKLGWTLSEFIKAASKLGEKLDGHISDTILYPMGRPDSIRLRTPEGVRKRKRRLRVRI